MCKFPKKVWFYIWEKNVQHKSKHTSKGIRNSLFCSQNVSNQVPGKQINLCSLFQGGNRFLNWGGNRKKIINQGI